MILVTGAAGSVGRALCTRLELDGRRVFATDLEAMDVTDAKQVERIVAAVSPDIVYHLAGAKHAFDGELDPGRTVTINTIGTQNVLDAAERVGARVIFSSTCKACDPETAYGASKLIAERMVLNAGGTVCRFYNIRESCGNVFRIWEQLAEAEPIPWTDCWRYFISMDQAVSLLLRAVDLTPGRYAADPGPPQHMREVAEQLYPDRELVLIPKRRGDRVRELLVAGCEDGRRRGDLFKISSPYDPASVKRDLLAA